MLQEHQIRVDLRTFSFSLQLKTKRLHPSQKYDNIPDGYTNVLVTQTKRFFVVRRNEMPDKTKYFVVRQKAVPEVLLKVVEAKRLLDTKRVETVQEAADQVGISRSSFYKYKDDIFPFRDNVKGKTLTFVMQMHDEPGLLSEVLNVVAEYHANILTIHQSIPTNGVATLTLSVEVLPETGDVSSMIETIEGKTGVQYLKILARE